MEIWDLRFEVSNSTAGAPVSDPASSVAPGRRPAFRGVVRSDQPASSSASAEFFVKRLVPDSLGEFSFQLCSRAGWTICALALLKVLPMADQMDSTRFPASVRFQGRSQRGAFAHGTRGEQRQFLRRHLGEAVEPQTFNFEFEF